MGNAISMGTPSYPSSCVESCTEGEVVEIRYKCVVVVLEAEKK